MKRALEEYKRRAAQLERIRKRFEVLRDKLEKLTELQSRTIEGVGMLLSTPASPEEKVAEVEALVQHFQELKSALTEPGGR